MVGFGAGRVDLAAHLLNDEAKLAARIFLTVNGVHEVLAVLAKTDFLLVDVKFLKVEDHLLLETGRIHLLLESLKILHQFLPHGVDPLLLEALHLILKVKDVPHP